MLSKQQKKKKLSTATRHKVVRLHQQGLSQTNISKQMVSQDVQFKLYLKKHNETGKAEDGLAADGKRIKFISILNVLQCHQFKTGRKQWHPGTTHLLSGEVWNEVAFNEWLQPKTHSFRMEGMETRPSDSTMHQNIGPGLQKNGSRSSGLMSQYLK